MNQPIRRVAWLAVLLVAAGCGSSTDSNDASSASMDDMARMLDQPQATASEKPATTKAAAPPKAKTVVAQEPPAPAPEPEKPHAAEVVQTPGEAQVIGQRKYRNTVEGPLRYYGAMASARMVIKDQLLWLRSRSRWICTRPPRASTPRTRRSSWRRSSSPT